MFLGVFKMALKWLANAAQRRATLLPVAEIRDLAKTTALLAYQAEVELKAQLQLMQQSHNNQIVGQIEREQMQLVQMQQGQNTEMKEQSEAEGHVLRAILASAQNGGNILPAQRLLENYVNGRSIRLLDARIDSNRDLQDGRLQLLREEMDANIEDGVGQTQSTMETMGTKVANCAAATTECFFRLIHSANCGALKRV